MKEQKNNQLKVNFENVDHSLYLLDYIKRKIQRPKFSNLNITAPDIIIKKDHEKGKGKYTLTVTMTVHKVKLYFKEAGDNLYALIDAVVRKINQRLAKMRNNNRNFHDRTALKYML